MAINVGIIYKPPLSDPIGDNALLEPGDVSLEDTNRNSPSTIRTFQHLLTAPTAAADGIGIAFCLENENSAGVPAVAVEIAGILTDVTDGLEEGAWRVRVMKDGVLAPEDKPSLYVDSAGVGIGTNVTSLEGDGAPTLAIGHPGDGTGGDKVAILNMVGSTGSSQNGIGAIHGYNKGERVTSWFLRRSNNGNDSGDQLWQTSNSANPTSKLELSRAGNFVIGTGSLSTTAQTGFLWIPTCPGVPTGTPSPDYTGRAAFIYDSTNDNLWANSAGTWSQV